MAQELASIPNKPAVIVVTALPKRIEELDGSVVHAIMQKPFDINLLGSVITKLAGEMMDVKKTQPAEVIPFRRGE